MIKAIIFDCFGVLVGKGFPETYRSAGGDPAADRDFIDDLLGQTNLGLISEATFQHAVTSHLAISLADWLAAVKRAEQPDLDLLAYIEKLHQTYKIAVLSNANNGVIEHKIGEDWLHKCFDEVIVSGSIGMVKPNPDIYTYSAEKLGISPQECVFLDDHDGFLVGAKKVGMHTVLYKNFEQCKQDLGKILAAQQ